MRVALLTNNFMPPREGISRHIFEIASRLPDFGIEPLILAKGEHRRTWQHSNIHGMALSRYPYWGLRPFHQHLLGRTLQVWCDGIGREFDLLHLHLPLLPALRTELPQFVTFHSPLLTDTAAIAETDWRARLVKWNAKGISCRIEQAQIDAAAQLLAVSRGVAEELRQNYRLDGKAVEVVTNGVDTKFFPYIRGHRRQPRLLYVGRLGYRKGLERLLSAFARLDHPRLLLELAGEGPLEALLRRQAVRLGIDERVRFLGFLDRNQLREKLKTAALLINPADYESGPLTLLEAMSAGTPVVTTPTGIANELGPEAPVRICAADGDAIAAAIDEILADPESARARALAARNLVERQFDWQRVVGALADRYRTPARLAA